MDLYENKKIVFFDIDGTLLNISDSSIPESTKKAIDVLQKKGVLTAIATGRNNQGSEKIAQELGIDILITLNGNIAKIKENTIYKNYIDKELSIRLTKKVEENNDNLIYFGDNKTVIYKQQSFSWINNIEENRQFCYEEDVLQIALLCDDRALAEYEKEFTELDFKPWVTNNGIDVNKKGASKQ